jgi:pyocin large subunit-like protein
MRVVLMGAAGVLALSLAACGGRPSAVPSGGQEQAAAPPASAPSYAPERQSSNASDPRDAPVPLVDGKPMWAANRKHTAEENAQYQFAKNGADFGARSEDDYVAKAHAFIGHPPSGAQTLQRRNGDTLIYDPRANVFAVASKDGAPRTLFKPRDGAAYWAQQKDREAKRTQTASRSDRDEG